MFLSCRYLMTTMLGYDLGLNISFFQLISYREHNTKYFIPFPTFLYSHLEHHDAKMRDSKILIHNAFPVKLAALNATRNFFPLTIFIPTLTGSWFLKNAALNDKINWEILMLIRGLVFPRILHDSTLMISFYDVSRLRHNICDGLMWEELTVVTF